MPELPEVETIRRDLLPRLRGRRVVSVAIHRGAERLSVTDAPRALERALRGRRIVDLDRHGKYLLVRLDDGRTWVIHLRMTGALIHVPPAAPAARPGPASAAGATDGDPADGGPALTDGRFERARVDLDDGSHLRFEDQRKFATWHLVADPAEAMPRVGPDVLSPEWSVAWLRQRLLRRDGPVKGALLDQRVAAGVGNIYADEACWIAGIDPRTPASALGPRRVTRLHAAVGETLAASLAHRGSSFRNYRDGLGGRGMHMVRVHVFRRDGLPCERCGATIRKTRVAGRGTHFCPGCQRR